MAKEAAEKVEADRLAKVAAVMEVQKQPGGVSKSEQNSDDLQGMAVDPEKLKMEAARLLALAEEAQKNSGGVKRPTSDGLADASKRAKVETVEEEEANEKKLLEEQQQLQRKLQAHARYMRYYRNIRSASVDL